MIKTITTFCLLTNFCLVAQNFKSEGFNKRFSAVESNLSAKKVKPLSNNNKFDMVNEKVSSRVSEENLLANKQHLFLNENGADLALKSKSNKALVDLTVTIEATETEVCEGEMVKLNGQGAENYTWSNGVQDGKPFVPTATTTYTVKGTDAAGNSGTATITITVNPVKKITVTASKTTICKGESVTLTASGGVKFSWLNNFDPTPNETDKPLVVTPDKTTEYMVTGADGDKCPGMQTIEITVNEPNVVITADKDSWCKGDVVSATLTASGATTYSWSSGGNGATTTVNPTATTTYDVTGTDANGCVAKVSKEIKVNELPTIVINADKVKVCAGGVATLTASGGVSYVWFNGVNTNPITVTPTAATTYKVVGTDANGCKAEGKIDIDITTGTLPTVTAIADKPKVCINDAVTLTGAGASTYSWSSGGTGTTTTVNPKTTTTYVVTGTDASGCSAQGTVKVEVNTLPNLAITADKMDVCPADPATLTASGATSYDWNNGDKTASTVVKPTVATTYTVTATDVDGCKAEKTITININALPKISTTSNFSAVCIGSSSILTATASGATPINFSWSSGGNGSNEIVSPTTPTTYIATATDSKGCKNTSSITIGVNPLPTVTATSSNTAAVCSGTQVTVTAAGATNYSWSTGANNASTTVTPVSTTVYNVTGTDANGCKGSASVTVNVTVVAITASSNAPAICTGAQATLTASGATSYSWSTGATSPSTNVSPTTTTTYNVTGTDAQGCTGTTTVTVKVNPLPTVTATSASATVCKGSPVILTAAGASTYTWQDGSTNTTLSVSPVAQTTYTVKGKDANGCEAEGTVTVNVNNLPTVTASTSSAMVCSGTSATLTAAGATSYSWSIGAVTATTTVAPTTTTTYTVTGTDANGCKADATVTVTVNPLPAVNAVVNNPTVCSGTPVTLTASGASTYSWSTGATTTTVNVTPTTTTTYTVTGTDANGCKADATVTVTAKPLPAVAINATTATICDGSTVILMASGANTYSWSNGVATATNSVTPSVTTNYTVTGTDLQGCVATAIAKVIVNANPKVTATADKTAICAGASVKLTGGGASTYQWSHNVVNAVSFLPTATATYTVNATDANGCKGSATVAVTVTPVPVVTITTNGPTLTANVPVATYQWLNCPALTPIAGAVNQAYVATVNGSYAVTATVNGCSATSACASMINVSIEENENNRNLSVFPNPSDGAITIKNTVESTYLLLNELGQTIQTIQLNSFNQYTHNIDGLANGMYFIIGQQGDQFIQRKVIVTR